MVGWFVEELELGLRECIVDVRVLLMYFCICMDGDDLLFVL